jgi:prophage regulatory protein
MARPAGFFSTKGNRMTQAVQLLNTKDLIQKLRKSRSWIYTEMAAGRFPKPIKIGARAVVWRESDIASWLQARQEAAV